MTPGPADDGAADGREHVVVVGAGITGLTAAFTALRAGAAVTVLEAAPRAGGAVRTAREEGYVAELGPSTLVATPAVARLVAELALEAECLDVLPAARRRYIVRERRPVAVPTAPLALIGSPLLSPAAKLRLLCEPFARGAPPAGDESVASFVRRRFGAEALAYVVEPVLGGIWGGDPEQLSARHVLGPLTQFERAHGSVARGALRAARARRAAREARAPRRIVSFRRGLEALIDALVGALGPAVRLDTPVRALRPIGGRWQIDAGRGGGESTIVADAVILATPAAALATLDLPPALARALAPVQRVPHVPLATLALGFRAADVAHPVDGFGVLVPAVERDTIMGVLFNSAVFANRAPAGHHLVTCFVGGATRPELAAAPTPVLVDAVLAELRTLLGVRAAPTFVRHTRWANAVPQYLVGHDAITAAAADAERANPGLVVAGQFRDGPGLSDCVARGVRAAEHALTPRTAEPRSVAEAGVASGG